MRRPGSLAEVADAAIDRTAFQFALAEFLDQFSIDQSSDMLSREPDMLADRFPAGDVCDAYLAAVAVALARDIRATPPAWSWQEGRKLRRPWFAHPGAALRATLLLESPAPFRERNLFVSANALSRA